MPPVTNLAKGFWVVFFKRHRVFHWTKHSFWSNVLFPQPHSSGHAQGDNSFRKPNHWTQGQSDRCLDLPSTWIWIFHYFHLPIWISSCCGSGDSTTRSFHLGNYFKQCPLLEVENWTGSTNHYAGSGTV